MISRDWFAELEEDEVGKEDAERTLFGSLYLLLTGLAACAAWVCSWRREGIIYDTDVSGVVD